jgi:hypothetical protein
MFKASVQEVRLILERMLGIASFQLRCWLTVERVGVAGGRRVIEFCDTSARPTLR